MCHRWLDLTKFCEMSPSKSWSQSECFACSLAFKKKYFFFRRQHRKETVIMFLSWLLRWKWSKQSTFWVNLKWLSFLAPAKTSAARFLSQFSVAEFESPKTNKRQIDGWAFGGKVDGQPARWNGVKIQYSSVHCVCLDKEMHTSWLGSCCKNAFFVVLSVPLSPPADNSLLCESNVFGCLHHYPPLTSWSKAALLVLVRVTGLGGGGGGE